MMIEALLQSGSRVKLVATVEYGIKVELGLKWKQVGIIELRWKQSRSMCLEWKYLGIRMELECK